MKTMWTRLRNKLRYLVGGRRIDRDLAQELDFHRDMLTADQERLGYSRGIAMLNARRKMGNSTRSRTRHARVASG